MSSESPQLFASIPFHQGRNLGAAYNAVMKQLDDDGWACFLDHDAMFTTRYWHHQISHAIRENPEAGAFTGVTNRIGNRGQVVPSVDPDNHDIVYHREIGRALYLQHGFAAKDITEGDPLSGVLIVISKKTWLKIGKFKSGFLGVDNRMHYDLRDGGYKVFLLPGVYVYHWYRANNDDEHLRGAHVADQGKHA